MIQVILSDRIYENDVYPLVKAFYPQETVKVYGPEEETLLKQDSSIQSGQIFEKLFKASGENSPEDSISLIRFKLEEDRVTIEVTDASGVITAHSAELIPLSLDKPKHKNGMKRALYQVLSDITGTHLPWGILTGIRPTKLVYDMLLKELDEVSIQTRMKEEYLCSEDKIRMSIRIAARELTLLKDMDYRNGYSLYIGIPFCPSTCLYCSFTSYPLERFADRVEEYLKALEKEILYGATCFPGKKLTTVYFGGGTPTTLTAEQLDRILGLVRENFDFTHVKEFCVEAGRPDSITRDKLEVLKKWGVDRISINPQSMQQRTLDLIGRRHSVEQIKEAFRLARETGHDNINMDLIIGLPGENPEDVRDTLQQIKELDPDSLTVHTLALKRAARLNIERENYAGLKAEDVPTMLADTIRFAEINEYLPYYLYRQKNMADNLENIGYARYGKEGLYNILIMEEQQTILALGAGAMTKFVFHEENRIERVDNVKSISDYIGRIDEMITKKQEFLLNNKNL
jgi:oxygen-independent coproporphyrinogen-3 oxidase